MRNDSTSHSKPRVRVERGLWLRSDGRYEAKWTDASGRDRSKTLAARIKTDARAEREALMTALRRGEIVAPTAKTTVAELARAWLLAFEEQVRAGERSERTLDRYRSNVECHIVPILGRRRVRDVRVEHVLHLIRTLRAEGKAA